MDKKEKSNNKSEEYRYKCFQCGVTVALNYEEIESHPVRVSNIKPFTNKYNWKGINDPSKIDHWKTSGKNNLTVVLNILYIKEKEIYPAYVSKYNLAREKQMILLMISHEEKERWHYHAAKKLSALVHRIT